MPALLSGEIDAIVNYLPPSPPDGIVCQRLYDNHYAVYASIRHRLAARKRVTLAELAQERWALSEPGLPAQQRLAETFHDNGLPQPQAAFVSRSAVLRLRVVAASDLVNVASRHFVVRSELALQVKALPVKEVSWLWPVGVMIRQETYLPPVLRKFVEEIKERAKTMGNGRKEVVSAVSSNGDNVAPLCITAKMGD